MNNIIYSSEHGSYTKMPDNYDPEAHFTRLEVAVGNIETDITDIKTDIRDIRRERREDFRLLALGLITGFLVLAGAMGTGYVLLDSKIDRQAEKIETMESAFLDRIHALDKKLDILITRSEKPE